MSDLRTAAQQGLEALEMAKINGRAGLLPAEIEEIADAITALHAALAQQAEPVRLQCVTCGTVYADGVPPQVPVQAEQKEKPWRCACGANLYIDENGAPRSKA